MMMKRTHSAVVSSGSLRWRIAQWAELHWWKRYLLPKNVESYLQWKRQYWRQLLQQISVPLPLEEPDTKVLDAGCGPAGVFMVLPHNEVVAFDPLLQHYAHLPHFNEAQYPNVQFFGSTLEQFYQEHPQRYNIVFCMNAINHVDNLAAAFDNLAALTLPKGFWVLTVDAHRYQLLKPIFRLLPGDILHPHQHHLNDYNKMIAARGFTILQTHLLQSSALFHHYLIVAQRND
ncbi:MAG: methyltransferase domain-containing protein [Sphingobacteriales bacterium]|nr:methyltransferase domain-containing protein [Sphingobacteriales bacterium]